MLTRSYAVELEHLASDILKIERFDISGLANADRIERGGAYKTIKAIVETVKREHNRRQFEEYLEKYKILALYNMNQEPETFVNAVKELKELIKTI